MSARTIPRQGLKSGEIYAHAPRRIKTRPGEIWHLGESGRITICCQPHWLWRAVNQDGYVLEGNLPSFRNTAATRRLWISLLKLRNLRPDRMIILKLKSCGADRWKIDLPIRPLSLKGPNNRAENSLLSLQKYERVVHVVRSLCEYEHLVSVFPANRDLFVRSASNTNVLRCLIHRIGAFANWNSAAALSV